MVEHNKHPISNPEYLTILKSREIELKGKEYLEEWLAKIPTTIKPRKASQAHCECLLILLYYLGCRPAELIDFKPKDITKVFFPATKESPAIKGYRVAVKTLKRGKEYRYLNIPIDKFTTLMYKNVKKQHPEQIYFHAFQSKNGGSQILAKWVTRKKVLVRENGQEKEEIITQNKERLYTNKNNKIYKYIVKLTGLPPYFFRHHRQTWLDEKGASLQEQADWKGGTIKSALIYRSMTGEKKKKQLQWNTFSN